MMETVALGLSGISTSRLCFGTGTQGWHHRSNQGDLGVERLSGLLRYAHERGITFWDTADMYGTHPHVADALRQVERESVTITTKTVSRTASEVRADVERFLAELRTDYIDIMLLHCLTSADWPEEMSGPMDVLSELKSRGQVRAPGLFLPRLRCAEGGFGVRMGRRQSRPASTRPGTPCALLPTRSFR